MERKDYEKQIYLLSLLVSAEVLGRGGRVEIPRTALERLIWHHYDTACKDEVTLEFVLSPRRSVRRDATAYGDRSLYRLEMAMKYLIETSKEKKLSFTNEDLVRGRVPFGIDTHNGGLLVHSKTSRGVEVATGGRTLILGRDTLKVFKDVVETAPLRKN